MYKKEAAKTHNKNCFLKVVIIKYTIGGLFRKGNDNYAYRFFM